MKKVIINADDFGMSKVFNEVILDLLENDFIKSTSVLVLRDIDSQSVQFDKLRDLFEQKDISIGLHFESNEVENDYEKISENIEYQKEILVKSLGFGPTHIDKHKKIYSREEAEAMIDFATRNNIYIRNCFDNFKDIFRGKIMTSTHVITLIEKDIESLKDILEKGLSDNEVLEIVAHPGKFDVACRSSLNKDREKDSEKIIGLFPLLQENDISMINQKIDNFI